MIWWILFLLWLLIGVGPVAFAVLRLISVKRNARNRYQHEEDNKKVALRARVSLVNSILWAVAAGFLISCVDRLCDTYLYHLWFQDVGYSPRYWTVWWTETGLFWFGFAVMALLMWWCFGTLHRHLASLSERKEMPVLKSLLRLAGFCLSMLSGLHAEQYWLKLQLAFHAQPFGKVDPIFGKDIGFYVFTLPLWDGVIDYLFWLLIVATASVLVGYLGYLAVDRISDDREWADGARKNFFERLITQCASLGICWLAVAMVNAFVARYLTLYSTHGKVYGAGWTDVNILIPAYWCMEVVLVACIMILRKAIHATDYRQTLRSTGLGFATAGILWYVGISLVPYVFQTVYVAPSELRVEHQFIQHELDFTRAAYGLDKIQTKPFTVKPGITTENLKNDTQALESARIWDAGTLADINRQLQAGESYYEFRDEDVSRYSINGRITQLYYSSRELDVDQLQAAARDSWQNRHLVYTHGYGGVANPVNRFTDRGDPEYFLRDIPAVSTVPELRLTQPRTYFSYKSNEHIYVNTRVDEYDYSDKTGKAVKFRYDGPAGFTIGGFWSRLAIASQLDGVAKLFSAEFKDDSRLIMHRTPLGRTRGVLPFLWYDTDPYQVLVDGQIWTICDFYTVSEWYPYSKPFNGHNYQRNAVKAVVNAYTGKTDFYLWDETDPVIKAYEAIFPGLFKPSSEMPANIRKHVRYPAAQLSYQAEVYQTYHMTTPDDFYNKSDAWQFARHFAPTHTEARALTANYAQVALPGSRETEYITSQLYTVMSVNDPNSRGELKAHLVARCDDPNYGQLILYHFEGDQKVQGPVQVGSKANALPGLSKDFTLWHANGSEVRMGSARVIPLSDSRLLTTQAVYMKAVGASMPRLQYVIVSAGDEVYYDRTFAEALNQLVNQRSSDVPPPPAGLKTGGPPPDLDQRIFQHIDKLRDLFRQGDMAGFGAELQQLLSDREQMKKREK